MDPLGVPLHVLCDFGILPVILKIRIFAPFDLFYHSLQLSYLLRFRSRPQDPTLLIIGAKQSFYTKSGHYF